MEKINFKSQDWENAQVVFDFFRQETNCFEKGTVLKVKPHYVVAIDDDMVSAFYAATIMKLSKQQFGVYPKLLCVGGFGMLSKHINRLDDGTIISEGMKLRMTALRFGNFPVTVLDNGNNTGDNIKEIIDYLTCKHDSEAPIIFCPTQRLSKRLERTVAFFVQQFSGTAPLNAYYYVPKENIEEMCQLYNGKALAGGLPLLSEAAAVYDRVGTERYANRYMATFDKIIPKRVMKAGMELAERYPIRISRIPLTAPVQFCKMFYAVIKQRKAIAEDLETHILDWKQQF